MILKGYNRMNKSYQYLDIDVNKKIHRRLRAVQGDAKSRYILVSLYNNSMAFDLSNCSVKIFGVKSDKKICIHFTDYITFLILLLTYYTFHKTQYCSL